MAAFRKELRAAVAEMRKSLSFRVDAKDAAADVARIGESFAKVARQAREARKAVSEVAKVRPGVTFTETGRSRIRNPFQSAVDADAGGYGTASGAFRQTQMNAEQRARLAELLAARREGLRGFNAQDYYGNRGQFAAAGGSGGGQVPMVGQAAGGSGGGQSSLAVAAQVGSVITGLRAGLGLLSFAVRAATSPLRGLAEVANQARIRYVQHLQTGNGAFAYNIRNQIIGSVLGVSEVEVIKYAGAIGFLNKRLEYSTRIFTQTTPALADMSVELRAAGQDIKAFFAQITADVAEFTKAGSKKVGGMFNSLTEDWKFSKKIIAAGRFANQYGVHAIPDYDKRTIRFRKEGTSDNLDDPHNRGITTIFERWLDKQGVGNSSLGIGNANVDRMQASPWERMGLVLGGQGAADYARQTANNTRRIADFLERQHTNDTHAGADRVRLRATPRTNTP